MPESPDIQPWKLNDLIDFEYLLRTDADGVSETRQRLRDEAIARDKIRPALSVQELRAGSPAARRKALKLWLNARRAEVERSPDFSGAFPGEALVHGLRTVTLIVCLVALSLGAGVIGSLLEREHQYFNVPLLLGAALLPQVLLLVVLLVGILAGRRSATVGFIQVLLQSAVRWLAEKSAPRGTRDGITRFLGSLRRRGYLKWPLIRLTQTGALFFNLGILGALGGYLAVRDIGFFWESTSGSQASETLHGVTDALSTPWSWAWPEAAPDLMEIVGTRIDIIEARKQYPLHEFSARAWAPFLFACLAFWGVLPRLILWIVSGLAARRAVARYAFNEREHRELWRRLTAVEIEVAPDFEGPGDDAVVILWGGFEPDPARLREATLQQLRLNPQETFTAGGLDPALDEETLAAVEGMRRHKPGLEIIVLAESWGLAPKDIGGFLQALREKAGGDAPIRCFITGLAPDKSGFAPPTEDEVKAWEGFLAELDDGNTSLHPFRKRAA